MGVKIQTKNIENIPCRVTVAITVSAKHHKEVAERFLKLCNKHWFIALELKGYESEKFLLKFEGTTSTNTAIDDSFVRDLRSDATDTCYRVTGFINDAIAKSVATRCFQKPQFVLDGEYSCEWVNIPGYTRHYNCDCFETYEGMW